MGSAKGRRGHCAKPEAIEVLAACEEAEHEGGEWRSMERPWIPQCKPSTPIPLLRAFWLQAGAEVWNLKQVHSLVHVLRVLLFERLQDTCTMF